MSLNDLESWLNLNIYKPLKSIDIKSNLYRVVLIIIIAYIVASLINISRFL